MNDFENIYAGRRVLVTGHTGFTGGWISTWLKEIGADVYGLSLEPCTEPNLYEALSLDQQINSYIGDINDYAIVSKVVQKVQPEIIFHLAAQPLVSVGYDDPIDTYMTNVMGTLHVLEEARNCAATKAVVLITTDKVYLNNENKTAFKEDDGLGGKDPYSASKACAELVAASYIQTMAERGNGVLIATARGGNIIGGGDWSANRIVPDYVRAKVNDEQLEIRSPNSTRPFQHVMSLVHGYLLLGCQLLEKGKEFVGGWNFGPTDSDAQMVKTLIEHLSRHWDSPEIIMGQQTFKEAQFLHLDSERARKLLHWNPSLEFPDTVKLTAEWYKAFAENPKCAREITSQQIDEYRRGLWTLSDQN